MLTLYLACLIFGGAFVGLSVFSGLGGSDFDKDFDKEIEFDGDADLDGDFDGDADLDGDADFDHEADLDGDGDVDVHGHVDGEMVHADQDIELHKVKRYNPFLSFKFYTFSTAFFGLTGTLLTLLSLNIFMVAAMSAGMGMFAGFGITKFLHFAGTGVGGKVLEQDDFRGVTGMVVLPISPDRAGRVRYKMKGRTMEMMASTDGDQVLGVGSECLVIQIEDGVAQVISMDESTTRGQA